MAAKRGGPAGKSHQTHLLAVRCIGGKAGLEVKPKIARAVGNVFA
jgi:hypothetical protein